MYIKLDVDYVFDNDLDSTIRFRVYL